LAAVSLFSATLGFFWGLSLSAKSGWECKIHLFELVLHSCAASAGVMDSVVSVFQG